MADNVEKDKDCLGDNWLSNWELQCLEEWENETNIEERLQSENERSAQKLWTSFQNSASSISRLYKEGSLHNNVSVWVPFQNCASQVTLLYKVNKVTRPRTRNGDHDNLAGRHLHSDSQDAVRRSHDNGYQCGYNRRCKELVNWIRKRRRHIRRDDLLAFLCGKTAPVRSHHHHRTGAAGSRASPRAVADRTCSPRNGLSGDSGREDCETDLQPFRDALALQGLNGAMSNISVGRHQQQSGVDDPVNQGVPDLPVSQTDDNFHYFILEEMARRCDGRKRSAPSADNRMDSPSRKRNRLCLDEEEEL